MSTNKSNKPELRFKGFYDDWEQRKFSDITYLSGEKNRDNLPYESYSITNESGFVPQDEKFENGGTMRDADKRMYYIVSPQSFAYNPARINVGSIGYQNTPKNVIVSSLYEIFKTTEEVDDRFLWHWFKSDDFQKLIVQLQEGGVRLYFYYDKLCMGSIALPSLAEQQRIGAYLDKLDHLITLHQRKCDNLKIIKKSMLDNLFPKIGEKVPKWRFKGFNNDWEQRKLDEISAKYKNSIVDGPFGSDLKTADYTDTGVLVMQSNYITSGNFDIKQPYYVSEEKAKRLARCHCKGGDILIAKIGANFGICNIIPKNIEDAVLSSNCMKVDLDDEHDNNFYKQYFNILYESGYYYSLVGITAQPALSLKFIKSLVVPSPSFEEQKKISEYFINLDNLITLHQSEVERLKKAKQFFLDKMFI